MIKICVVADSFSLNMSGYCELTLFVTSFGNKTAWCSPAVKSFATQLKLQLFFLKELQGKNINNLWCFNIGFLVP